MVLKYSKIIRKWHGVLTKNQPYRNSLRGEEKWGGSKKAQTFTYQVKKIQGPERDPSSEYCWRPGSALILPTPSPQIPEQKMGINWSQKDRRILHTLSQVWSPHPIWFLEHQDWVKSEEYLLSIIRCDLKQKQTPKAGRCSQEPLGMPPNENKLKIKWYEGLMYKYSWTRTAASTTVLND